MSFFFHLVSQVRRGMLGRIMMPNGLTENTEDNFSQCFITEMHLGLQSSAQWYKCINE